MKKILLFGGIGLFGFGFYRYFKYQVDLALNYDYKIKNFEVLGYNKDKINVSIDIEIKNNSSFEILVKEYDLNLFFKGKNFANTKVSIPFAVLPNTSFRLKTTGEINVVESKVAILPFIQDILARRPINVEVEGFIKVKFLGLNYTMKLNKEKFEYSADLLKDVGLSEKINKFKIKNASLSKFFGIK